MLGNEEADVRAQREQVLRGLAARIAPESDGAEMPELEAIVANAVEADSAPDTETDDDEPIGVDDPLAAFVVPAGDEEDDDRPAKLQSVPDWLAEPEYEARPREREPRSRRRTVLILVGLAAVLAVIVGIQRAGGSSGNDSSTPTPAPSQPAAATQTDNLGVSEPEIRKGPAPTTLTSVGTTGATGTASIANGHLTMNVKGLPDPKGGTYTVWLYNSVIDSRAIGKADGTTIKLNVKLPADAKNYKYVDVSLQPAGSNANHSGESVLRVATAKL